MGDVEAGVAEEGDLGAEAAVGVDDGSTLLNECHSVGEGRDVVLHDCSSVSFRGEMLGEEGRTVRNHHARAPGDSHAAVHKDFWLLRGIDRRDNSNEGIFEILDAVESVPEEVCGADVGDNKVLVDEAGCG